MKIYDYVKKKYRKTSKLFGITIFEQIFNYMTTKRYQYFLNGIITTYKVKDIYDYHIEKEIKILGKIIFKRIEDGNNIYWYAFDKRIRKVSSIDAFKTRYFRHFDKKYDHIYILNANSGEIFLFLTYVLNSLLKKNGSKNPLLVATKEYHFEMINMICPKIPSVYIKSLDVNVKGDFFEIEKQKFFQIFPNEYFIKIETKIKDNPPGQVHYFNSMLQHFNLTPSELIPNKILVSTECAKSAFAKAEALGLNLKNFVYIAPEARSCMLIDNYFWEKLIEEYTKLGIDVFVNLIDKSVNLKEGSYKTCYLSYSEAFSLAGSAKKIVSLRSGLSELLLETGVPIDVLYNKFKNRRCFNDMTVRQIMSGFMLEKLPDLGFGNIAEYTYDCSDWEQLIEKIVDKTVVSADYE